MEGPSKELRLLLAAGGWDVDINTLINMLTSQPPYVFRLREASPIDWGSVSHFKPRHHAIRFYRLETDRQVLTMPVRGEEPIYILPALKETTAHHTPHSLEIEYAEAGNAFLGKLTLKEPPAKLVVDVLNPWMLNPKSQIRLTMVCAEATEIPPVDPELSNRLHKAEEEGKLKEVFEELASQYGVERILEKYVEFTGWRNRYAFITTIKTARRLTNPLTGQPYIHATAELGPVPIDMLIPIRYRVREGSRIKGFGLLELLLIG